MTGRARPTRRRPRTRRRIAVVLLCALLALVLVAGLAVTSKAVLDPTIDSPARVDGIVVVAGADDDRYTYARHLAEEGVADSVIVSAPTSGTATRPPYSWTIGAQCATGTLQARDGRRIDVGCFTPDSDTTEGETTAATRIAHERGWESLLVVTYWGHVSRVRQYFEQCFAGDVNVTDTPRPLSKSRADALLHETGGYVKAYLSPAC